ncbi:hypothetical protein [Actinoallomurus rhizosphaericola]|uniref:hypothetical protein n=1 Tax=Actinoallomurus rhizosphaericola TaxID=2952536 RepID=UPI0020908AAC|nr:hypothetical protein [Actinoallomurus rhizosphaericola]MCO5992380.1 hypothetical protein [Actinoallomurus rhizosphaericola]
MMRSRVVQLSAVSLLSLSIVGCSDRSETAYCIDSWAPVHSSYRVVPDYYCDNGGSYGRYYWYYGGSYRNGYVSRGTSIRPRGPRIVSRGGRVISRGSSHSSHSGSHGVSRGGFGHHGGSSRGG